MQFFKDKRIKQKKKQANRIINGQAISKSIRKTWCHKYNSYEWMCLLVIDLYEISQLAFTNKNSKKNQREFQLETLKDDS